MSERFERYDRKIFWRDVREILASGVVAAFYGYEALAAADPLARIGALVVVAGAALVVWRLNGREARCSLRPRRRSLVRALDRMQETDVAEVANASE